MIATGNYILDDANFEAEQDQLAEEFERDYDQFLSEELIREFESGNDIGLDEDADLDIDLSHKSVEDTWYIE